MILCGIGGEGVYVEGMSSVSVKADSGSEKEVVRNNVYL